MGTATLTSSMVARARRAMARARGKACSPNGEPSSGTSRERYMVRLPSRLGGPAEVRLLLALVLRDDRSQHVGGRHDADRRAVLAEDDDAVNVGGQHGPGQLGHAGVG